MRYRAFVGAGTTVLFGFGMFTLAGCGGSTKTTGGGGGSNPTTPTVTVSASPSSITTAQATTVTVTVSGSSGTATGSVTLTSGSYSSGATTLSNGSATISIAAGKLAAGTDTLAAVYSPDAGSSATYAGASGTGSVTVSALVTPTVTVTPNPSSITTTAGTTVTVAVTATGGTPSGSVTLTSGSYSSGAVTLSNGSAQIPISAGKLAIGNDTLTAAYTPDTNGSLLYNSQTGTGSVTVSATTPTVTVTANPSSTSSTGTTTVTVAVSGGSGNPTPTGSVTLTSGTYNSGATTLTNGSAQIAVQGSSLATGNNVPLNATYTTDANGSATYSSASGSGSVNVVKVGITSFTASANPIPYGSTSTQLTGVFTGGTGVITPGSLPVTSGTPVTVTPAANTTYTLTVTPTTGTAVTQTVSVSLATGGVTVNPASPGIAVTDQIMGTNLAVWGYDFGSNPTPLINAFQSAGIVALRWPGGSTSDDYHWNGANANPANGVPPTPSICAGQYQNPDTNYLNFINKLEFGITGGFDIALTADYGTNAACNGGGDPTEAANWVAYAYANGGVVSHVTVGNENYGNWEEDMHAVKHDPTTYANSVAGTSGYYDLIKAQSSSTLVGVIVDANCTTANGCTNGWDSTVLGNATGCNGTGTPCYDFVEYHFYPQNPGNENDNFLIKQAPHIFTTNINTIKNELQTAGVAGTPIMVGEIGSVSSNPGKQSWSITQGLYAGQILGEMMNDGIWRANWWIGFTNCNGNQGSLSSSLYGWQTFGAYNIFSDGPGDKAYPNNSPCTYGGNGTFGTMSPTAIAFDLFSNVAVAGENVLTPTVAGDTADIVAYAATHSGGTAIVLFNRNQTTSQTVTITLTGKSNSSGVTWYWYDKEIYDYTNTTCAVAPTCTVDPNHDYSSIDWVGPTSTSLGPQTLPLTVTLQPWSMNVFIIQ